MKNYKSKYLIETVDDEEFFSDLGYNTDKEETFQVDDNIYEYKPKTRIELENIIKELLEKEIYDLNIIDISRLNDLSNLFMNLNNNYDLSKVDISGWDFSNIINMSNFMYNCSTMTTDIEHWNLSNVKSLNNAFYKCTSLTSDISKLVKTLDSQCYCLYTFKYCENIKGDLSDLPKLICSIKTFLGCPGIIKPKWYREC